MKHLLAAVYDEKSLLVTPYEERLSALAVYVSGSVDLVTLLKISAVPILYTSSDSIFDMSSCEAILNPELSRGVCALASRMGRERLMEAILTARGYAAEEALRVRIVEAVLSVEEFTEQIERASRLSVSATKLACELASRSRRLSVEQAEIVERYAFALRFASADQKEGMTAFLEKRPPRFS